MLVKISGVDSSQIKKNISEVYNSVGLLLSGGADFIIKCAKTESFTKKEIVKNVINCCFNTICLVFFSQSKEKHNSVKEISLQTTKSVAITIFENQDSQIDTQNNN